MDSQSIIAHARRLQGKLDDIVRADRSQYSVHTNSVEGLHAQVTEFLSTFAGARSHFTKKSSELNGMDSYRAGQLSALLDAFVDHLESGLVSGISPERKGQLDVVSDLMSQAQSLLDTKGIHPAAPIVIAGASIEEFLRTWVESAGLSLGNRKPGLASYSQVLRDAELIDKQDAKDIEAWGGLRNHAAHGEWEKVADSQRAGLMLQGVNLFMRRRGSSAVPK